jgi:hypothetical protein
MMKKTREKAYYKRTTTTQIPSGSIAPLKIINLSFIFWIFSFWFFKLQIKHDKTLFVLILGIHFP